MCYIKSYRPVYRQLTQTARTTTRELEPRQGNPTDEVRRILPDRLGFHPLREIARDFGGTGAWIGRREPGELLHGHHRYRSAGVRADLRTVLESGAHQHAGYRHRLSYPQARRGDPIRH